MSEPEFDAADAAQSASKRQPQRIVALNIALSLIVRRSSDCRPAAVSVSSTVSSLLCGEVAGARPASRVVLYGARPRWHA